MKRFSRKLVFVHAVSFAVLLLTAGVLPAGLEAKQEHMENALHLLQDALKSDQPVALMESAKRELEKAKHDKGGFRGKAVEQLDQAMAEQRAGDKSKVNGEITNVIATIHSGMSKGH